MKSDLPLKPGLMQPTRVRYGVLAFVSALSMVTYLDRVCFGAAAPEMVKALGLQGVEDLGWAFFAFTFFYAAFEIPTGWLGDVFGPRKTLIRIVLWWSVFTALTGLVGMVLPGGIVLGLGALVVIRALFGIGEAGAYPNITRALHNWFPARQRGFAQGAMWFSGRLMGGLTPLVLALLIQGILRNPVEVRGGAAADYLLTPLLNWRQAFWVFGGMGTLWCVLFALWFRNHPREKKTVNAAEAAMIGEHRQTEEGGHHGVPWRKILLSPNLWCLSLMYFCGSYGWYFNITYLPSFLEEQYKVDPSSLIGSIFKGGPLLFGAAACLLGGMLTDRFIRRTGDRKWGRRLFGLVGHGLCAVCYFACLFAPSAFWFFLTCSLAAFFNDLTMGAAWATCQDIGRRYAAIVAGCMNTVGNMGGAAAAKVTGYLLQMSVLTYASAHGITDDQLSPQQLAAGHVRGYQMALVSFGLVYLVAVFLWTRIDATRPVDPTDVTAESPALIPIADPSALRTSPE